MSDDHRYQRQRRQFLLAAAGTGVAAATSTRASAQAAVGRALPTTWDATVDVIVIGSGFAGCAAAAAAAEAGCAVAVLEKMPAGGGNSAINLGDFAAWDSSLHLRRKLNLGDDSAAQHARDILEAGDGYSNPLLVDVLVNGAPAALDWMIERGGLKLRDVIHRQGSSSYRMHYGPSGRGVDYIEALRRIAGAHNTRFHFEHAVARLWRHDAEGPVAGVELRTPQGPQQWRARRAVIIAAGGFGADVAMRSAFRPILTSAYNTTNHRGATGEMIRLAQAAGADALQLEFIEVHPYGDPATGALDTATSYALQIRRSGSMLVAKNGRRFVNEMALHDHVSRKELATGERPTFTVFNQAMLLQQDAERNRVELPQLIARGRVLRADSLRELAASAGIAAALEDTAQRYAQMLRERKDPDFGRPFAANVALFEGGPWYAIPNWPSVHHTMGGLRIDTAARVIDIWGRAIPRLYAAGEVTGGIHGAARIGGNSSADPVVFGRIAGSGAAAETAI
jgi:urocanate reductase